MNVQVCEVVMFIRYLIHVITTKDNWPMLRYVLLSKYFNRGKEDRQDRVKEHLMIYVKDE
jgi:hypothetical protein